MTDDLDLSTTPASPTEEPPAAPPPSTEPTRLAPDVLDPDALTEARAFFRLASRGLARLQDPHVLWELLAEAQDAADRALGPGDSFLLLTTVPAARAAAMDPAPVEPVATTGSDPVSAEATVAPGSVPASTEPAAPATALAAPTVVSVEPPPRPAASTAAQRRSASDDVARAETVALEAYLRARLFWSPPSRPRTGRRLLLRALGGAAVGALVIGTGVAAETHLHRRRDLAAGKPWEVSSQWGAFSKQGTLGRSMPTPFFHTEDDPEPWLDIDLGAPQLVSRLEIDNRVDYGKDRAVPLTVQVATVRGTWRQVARRDDVFDTWKVTLAPPTQARWVRLQVKRRTYFHLDDVRVY